MLKSDASNHTRKRRGRSHWFAFRDVTKSGSGSNPNRSRTEPARPPESRFGLSSAARAAPAAPAGAPGSSRADVAAALIALGYSDREAQAAAKRVPEDASVSDGIRLALKSLSR